MTILDAFWNQFRALIDEAATDEYAVREGDVLSEAQAQAILDMRLQKLTGLERDKVKEEYEELKKAHRRVKSYPGR